ncbi:MAG: DUF3999 domain-containing protein [Burkholderiaceae bacterium]
MKRPIRCAAALLITLVGAAQAQNLDLQTPITLQGPGPFHRLTLPSAIYSRAAFDDLRDVRVRNAAGQAVPFAWLDADLDTPSPATASLRAPLFAVPGAAAAQSDATLALTLRPDGSLGWAKTPGASASAGAVMQWVIDASQLDAALVQARFELAPGAQGLFPFTLEGSNDLRQWRSVGADDQLVRLQRGEQTVERLAVEIDHVRTRYLRLRWQDPARAPALAGVWLDGVRGTAPVAAIEWSPEVRATACGVDFCDYAVPRHLPLQSLRVALAEPNTLAPLRVFSLTPATMPTRAPRNALYVLRHGAAGRARDAGSGATPELWLADTVVYRLSQPGGEALSASVPMDGGTHTSLRLRTNGPVSALGATPPVLSFGGRPRTLAFLAQGQAPFVLSWNASGQAMERDIAGPLPPGTLMPGFRAGQPIPGSIASVSLQSLAPAAATAASAGAAPAPDRKLWLWAALGAGLILLATMAWSLLRGLSKQASDPAP